MKIQVPDFANSHPQLVQAIQFSNNLLAGDKNFFNRIRVIPTFDYSKNSLTNRAVSGEEIVKLFAQKIDVTIQQYKPWYIWSSATAYTLPKTTIIHLNTRKLDRPVNEMVATLIHECIHILDKEPGLSFGHGNNFPKHKEHSAPYQIEGIAKELAE